MSPGFGATHRHYRLTDSTNLRAKELAMAGAPGGLVVTASEQTSGRGRQGRSWFARPGSALLYSALLRPLGERPLLPLAVPLAVCDAAESLASLTCKVKWPNDVWVGTRKLAGILVEGRPEADGGGWAVIGVGLNLSIAPDEFPPELREIATSLRAEDDGARADVAQARAALDQALETRLGQADSQVLSDFRARDALVGRDLRWQGGSGTAAGIGDSGHLLVETADGPIELGAGEVHLDLGSR